jgi:hypothetical protein
VFWRERQEDKHPALVDAPMSLPFPGRRIALGLFLGLAVAAAACTAGTGGPNGSAPSAGGDAPDGSSGASGDGDGPSDAGADAASPSTSATSANGELSIVHVASTVKTITQNADSTESDSAQFVAIVTDKAGLDTIAGGTLEDDTGITYGAFSAGANKGTYVASVTFEQINSIRRIDFPQAGGTRTFVVRFIDNAGNVVTASLSLDLRCRLRPAGYGQSIDPSVAGLVGACGGACTDLNDDPDNCGACGTPTCATFNAGGAVGDVQSCVAGSCVTQEQMSACVDVAVQPAQTCDAVCASLGAGLKCDHVFGSTMDYGCQYVGNGGREGCSVPFGSLKWGDTEAVASSIKCTCGK